MNKFGRTRDSFRTPSSGLLALSLLLAPAAWAHFPELSDGAAVSAETAVTWVDPQVSRVLYHELTPAAPRVWITFEVDAPQTLLLQLGVPQIERLADYRPALALLGPGLPRVQVPFDVPDGMGARIFDAAAAAQPQLFHEPFSGTDSRIWIDEQVTLPAPGRYYLVGYQPQDQPGKIWVAAGTQEVFAITDLPFLVSILDDIRGFHESTAAPAAPPCFLFPAAAALAWMALAPRSGVRGRRAS